MKFTIGAVIADRKLEIKSYEELAELMKGMKMLLEAFMKLKKISICIHTNIQDQQLQLTVLL